MIDAHTLFLLLVAALALVAVWCGPRREKG